VAKIFVLADTVEGETGEGFRLAIERHVNDDDFLAMNGDELTNLNLQRFIDFHFEQKGLATIAVSPMQTPFAILKLEGQNIIEFCEKPILPDVLVNSGVYVFNHKISDYLPKTGAIERTAFPDIAEKRLLKAYKLGKEEKWLTINCIKDLSVAEKEFDSIRGLQ